MRKSLSAVVLVMGLMLVMAGVAQATPGSASHSLGFAFVADYTNKPERYKLRK